MKEPDLKLRQQPPTRDDLEQLILDVVMNKQVQTTDAHLALAERMGYLIAIVAEVARADSLIRTALYQVLKQQQRREQVRSRRL